MKFSTICLFFLFSLTLFTSFAQENNKKRSFKDRFIEGNLLMDDKRYELAVVVWLDLLNEDPDNANLNYKAGLCYFTLDKKTDALPYFEKAITNTSKNYDILIHTEKRADVKSFYYMARCYHSNAKDSTMINKALEYYTLFETNVKKKHYLLPDVERQKVMCANAKELMNEYSQKDVNIINLGNNVNSQFAEHSPILSLDEKAIYYTSKRLRKDSSNLRYRDEKGLYFDDIYVSYKNDEGQWQEPELLNINIISDHVATVSLSADGQMLYVYKDDGGNGNLYQSRLLGETWSEPEPLGSDINTDAFETHIAVSPDNRRLYFVSDRKGGFGGKDIYRCKKLPSGEWGMAQNVGPTINTPYDEEAPFLHTDGKTLYFSSNGHKSMGGYDIFYSVLQDKDNEVNENWSEPQNIGFPINTTDDDVFYIESPDGKRAYYSSGKNEKGYGEKDIYMIELPKSMEKVTTILKGYIKIADNAKLPEDIMIILTDNETGERIGGEYRPRSRDGGYVLPLQPGKSYNISYEAEGYEFYNTNIFVPFGSEYSEIDKAIMLQPVNIGGSGEIVEAKPKWHMQFEKLSPEAVKGLKVSFYDDNGTMLFSESMDEKGNFSYRKLPPDKNIIMKINSSDPKLCENIKSITLMDNEGNPITQIQKDNCQFTYTSLAVEKLTTQAPSLSKKETTPVENQEISKAKWQVKFAKLSQNLPEGMTITFVDDEGKILFWEEPDKNGFFDYHALPKDKNILMKLEVTDIRLCDEIDKIVLLDNNEQAIIESKQGEKCVFTISKQSTAKLSSSQLTMTTKNNIAPENKTTTTTQNVTKPLATDSKGISSKEATDDKLSLNTTQATPATDKLTSDNQGISPKEETNEKVSSSTTTQTSSFEKIKPDASTIKTKEAENEKIAFATSEKIFYQEYFNYNVKVVNQNNPDFISLIEKIVRIINEKGNINLSIESSASRVPTRTYSSNMELTKLRGKEAQELLLTVLQKKGIDRKKVRFVDISTLVQGPAYQGDYTNKSKYEKYQYVKINVIP